MDHLDSQSGKGFTEIDQCFVLLVSMLLATGSLMVFSSSITARPSEAEQLYLSKQVAFMLCATLGAAMAACAPKWIWKKVAILLFAVTILFLVAVLIPGWGRKVNGAQRWFKLGTLSFQPSETAKITLPLMIATLRYRGGKATPNLRACVVFLSIIFVNVTIIAIEPDLGTALFVGITGILALYYSGWPMWHFVVIGFLAAPAAGTLLILKPYQWARIQGFLNTWTDPSTAPYQIRQSLTTLGVGGWQGTGLGRGRQKLSFLPEANTDFIFSVIGEELGLLGTLAVLALWVGVYRVGWKLIERVPRDSFEAVLAATLLTQIVLQAAINVAVVTALVPPKGISHPFISYGGSNLAVNLLAVGMILSLTRASPGSPDPPIVKEVPNVAQVQGVEVEP